MKIVIATLLLLASTAHANIVCRGNTDYGPAQVEINESFVRVSGAGLTKPRVFTNLAIVNGLITAPGLAVTFQNHYGCIRNAKIITDLREPIGAGYMGMLEVFTCAGGQTPDSLCHPN